MDLHGAAETRISKVDRRLMKRLTTESWDPDYDDKPVNQFGEKWQKISDTWLNSTIDYIIKDL